MDNMREAQSGAAEIMLMCEGWLQHSRYLLGEAETMADVLLMNMMTRLSWNSSWFATNVLSKPHLRKYWEEHR